MENLRPCPFCGGTELAVNEHEHYDDEYEIWCHSCSTAICFYGEFDKSVVIQHWNRRINAATESDERAVNPAGMPG